MGILEIAAQLRARAISPVELTKNCLARIEKLNPVLNAFITVTADSALAQAHQAETEIFHGNWRGPLHGIPIGLKDIIDTAGIRTTAASALFKDRIPTEDAEVVHLLKNAGAVILGKQNLHEFAYGGSSVVSYYGAIHNPWNPAHITGGSSGGSAAAVSAGLCYGAIGTDTAGSVREPAALCGVVGLKPTFGRVSPRGVVPLSTSLDHIGPIASTVADAAAILQCLAGFDAIAGFDEKDSASANTPTADYIAALDISPKSLRLGIPHSFFYEDLDPEIASAMELALTVLKTLTAEIRDVDVRVPTDRTLQSAESYAWHAKFIAQTPELYQPETLRRLRTGEKFSEAQIEQSRRELDKARHEIGAVFDHVDLLITPTTPLAAPALAELQKNPELLRPTELRLLRNTRPANVWGLPAISIPCGFTESGLPVGLQIVGPHWGEAQVLQLAYAYERATTWHKRQPRFVLS
jgi:aspartyl-tRNA(Asn)/glutamyl-tRNA(Gln) amidotransferase subunit A